MGDLFEVGDVVQLRSGGPLMTVEHVSSTVQTRWFHNGELANGVFVKDALVKVPVPQG